MTTTDTLLAAEQASRLVKDPLLTVDEVAAQLGRGRDTIFKLLKGDLPSVKIGQARRIRKSDLERYIASLPVAAVGDVRPSTHPDTPSVPTNPGGGGGTGPGRTEQT